MRAAAVLMGTVFLVAMSGCGSVSSVSVESAEVEAESSVASESVVSWRTLGCAEPAALVVESSDALETDIGLAAGSMADTYGLTIEETQRRLRLQDVLGQALAEVQAAEAGRVARSEIQHQPTYAAVVTLTGSGPISNATRDILCRTPELEVRLGAVFTEDELVNETVRLGPAISTAVAGLTSWGPGDGELRFDVVDDAARDQLDALLATLTEYPYSISSLGLPPFVLDPNIPFPLLDTTGRASTGVGLSGTLTIDGPCVYLNDVLVILPARETMWDPTTGVLNTGSGDLRSGDSVTGGGDRYTGSLDDLDQPPDPTCRLDGGVFLASFAPVNPNATPGPVPPGFELSGSKPAIGAPPEPPDAPLFQLEPRNPQAGETFTANFDADSSRGGFFHLRRWEGSDWSTPRFALESGFDGPPTFIKIDGEGIETEDYGAGGAGPDPLIMPGDIEPGQWRLCTANAGIQLCTQISIND